jgi:dihydroneopterin aldolase
MMQRDQLSVEGLRLNCMLGAQRYGTLAPQEVVVAFTLHMDLTAACRSDSLADTIDLAKVVTSLRRYAACAAHELIESLAHEIARILITDFSAQEVTVSVRKLQTPRGGAYESVTLNRQRAHFKAGGAPPTQSAQVPSTPGSV